MYAPNQTDGGAPPSPTRDSTRNARYTYLVGRLHGRQMTMEEATELFTLMQGMLQASEAARIALMRTPSVPSAPPRPLAPPERPSAPPSAAGDDLLLVGLLAMGAGAGLLAAMTKRIQDVTTPTPTTPPSRPKPDSSSQPG